MGSKRLRKVIRSSQIAERRLRILFDKTCIYPRQHPLDVAVLGLLSKSFQVHKSVILLCKKEAGSEAYALSRVNVEIFLGVRWISNVDSERRAKQYGLFGFKRKQYWATVADKYYPNTPHWKAALRMHQAAIDRYARNYKYLGFWANLSSKLKGMAQETENLEPNPSPARDALWDYEFPYAMASDHVHATITAIDDLLPTPGVPFKVNLSSRTPQHIETAVFTSTSYLFKTAWRIDLVLALDLDEHIGKIITPFTRLFPRSS